MTFLVGAYATAPRPIESDAQFREYVEGVESIEGVDGLEIPYQGPASPWNSLAYLAQSRAGRRHVLTMAPGLVGGLASNPRLGLASRDEDSRRQAIRLVDDARRWMQEVEAAGGASFSAIEVQSSPPLTEADPGAFAASMEEIAAWDWHGATVLIEHCDAGGLSTPAAKGYLPLDDEIRIARKLGIRMLLNWGRSAIETRSVEGARAQIAHVANDGLLEGLILSGVSDRETVHGAAWGDLHVPVRHWAEGTSLQGSDLDHAADASLLDRDGVTDAVRAARSAGSDPSIGVKVAPPPSATPEERLEIVRAHVGLVRGAAQTA